MVDSVPTMGMIPLGAPTPIGMPSAPAAEEKETGHCSLHPQSMCPAFGSLRVLTRVEGVQPVMATDQGCLYGLTFVTHFYGARKSIIAPEIGSNELIGGTIMQGTIAACEAAAREPGVRVIPVLSLCVAETQGFAEEQLPKKIGDAEVILVRVPAYAIHSHPEAKDVALAAMLKRLADPRDPDVDNRSLLLLGEVFPADPMLIDQVLRRMGGSVATVLPGRTVDDFVMAGQVGAVASLHPFYKQSLAVLREKRVPVVGGAPVGSAGTEAWLRAVGRALGLDPETVTRVAAEEGQKIRDLINAHPLSGRVIVSGYEGNELSYARLLVEAGATVPYVSTSIGPSPLTAVEDAYLRSHGTHEIIYRKTLEHDLDALDKYGADLVIGTTPFSAAAKERGIPAMYYTNLLSVRPFFMSAGIGATVEVIREALERGPRYRFMRDFFEDDGDPASNVMTIQPLAMTAAGD